MRAGGWPEAELHGTGHVFLQRGSEQGKLPLFVLNESGSVPVALKPEIYFHGSIVQCAAARNKFRIDLGVAIAKLNGVARAQPIAARCLNARAIPAHPIAHQESAIGIQVVIKVVPIDKLTSRGLGDGVGERSFNAQIEFREAREVGNVHPGIDSGAARSCEWRRVIVSE